MMVMKIRTELILGGMRLEKSIMEFSGAIKMDYVLIGYQNIYPFVKTDDTVPLRSIYFTAVK